MALGRPAILLGIVMALFGGGRAGADHEPVIVIPGRTDVPVIINGRDATGAMLIGEWGLYRPGHRGTTIVPLRAWRKGWRVRRDVHRTWKRRRPAYLEGKSIRFREHASWPPPYFPGGSIRPEPRRDTMYDGPPQPAESFSREWTTTPERFPVNTEPPAVIEIAPVVPLRRRP